jgi:hypothetical protein
MTSTDLAQRETEKVDIQQAARMSRSKLVPEHLANDAASAEYVMRIAAALGIDPTSGFQHIYVFPDGKGRLRAGMSAHLMHALALAAGHEVKVEGNAMEAKAVLIRHTSPEKLDRFRQMREEERRGKLALLEDTQRLYNMERDQIRGRIEDLQALAELGGGDELNEEIKSLRQQLLQLSKKYDFEKLREQISQSKFDLAELTRFESAWNMARAKKAGLDGKSVWQGYGPEMLKSRAKASVVRDGAIDVILGVKRILNDLGLEYSSDMDDEIAISNVVYTPEELGVEVDEEGRPLKGRVVNVTAPGASKTQDRKVRGAMKLIDGKDAEGIKKAVEKSLNNPDVSDEDNISRLDAVLKAVDETGRRDETVTQDDETCTLATYLQIKIDTLNNTADTSHKDEEEDTK